MGNGFAGLDVDGMLTLEAALRAAADGLERQGRQVAAALDLVGQAADAPARIRAVVAWCRDEATDVRRRRQRLEHDLAKLAAGLGAVGGSWRQLDCNGLLSSLEATAAEVEDRLDDHMADPQMLRFERPYGPFSYAGHREQLLAKQRSLQKRLAKWDSLCGPETHPAANPSPYARHQAGRDLLRDLLPLPAAVLHEAGWLPVRLPLAGALLGAAAAPSVADLAALLLVAA